MEDKKLAALLSYLLGWVTGIIFLLIEKDSYVRFHALQSICTFGGLTVLSIIISILQAMVGFSFWALFGLIHSLIWLVALILWIVLMIKAYQGERFKLPVVGDIAEKYAG